MSQTIHVAVSGDDANPGTGRKPVATLERARDLARRSRPSVVLLHEGLYSRAATFELGPADAGTTYRAAAGERVRIIGGQRLAGFSRVTDPAVLRRLSPAARRAVRQVSLRENGIRDFGRMQSRGFSRPSVPSHMELFYDGKPMTLARWPNEGEDLKIAGIPEGAGVNDGHGQTMGVLKAGFSYASDRPRRWKADDDIWVHGYWAWDWANSYERVKRLERRGPLIKTCPPHGSYGFRAGQRFYFLNVLEELDQPGECYVDRQAGILYFWPPTPTAGMARPWCRSWPSPDPSERRTARDRSRTDAGVHPRANGVDMRGGCRVTGSAGASSAEHGQLRGADRGRGGPRGHGTARSTTPGTAAWRCPVATAARSNRGGTACVQLPLLPAGAVVEVLLPVGAGARRGEPGVAQPHPRPSALPVLFDGNEHVIEFNEIHHVCMETGDVGAIYTGRDWTYRGNVVRHNCIHHTGGVGMGSMGIYLDDCVAVRWTSSGTSSTRFSGPRSLAAGRTIRWRTTSSWTATRR